MVRLAGICGGVEGAADCTGSATDLRRGCRAGLIPPPARWCMKSTKALARCHAKRAASRAALFHFTGSPATVVPLTVESRTAIVGVGRADHAAIANHRVRIAV